MMKENTIVQTHPWLIKILGSKNPGHAFVATTPLYVVFISYVVKIESYLLAIGLFFLALLYWSFIEYAIHRWPYHTRFKNNKLRWFFETFHLYHHRNIDDRRVLNAGPLMIYPMVIILLMPIYIILRGNLSYVSAFGIGLALSYNFYECVHFLIHYKKFESGYFSYIQKYHLYHHYKNWNKNFGNTSHLWDVILGTYDKKYKVFNVTEEYEREMITENRQKKEQTSLLLIN